MITLDSRVETVLGDAKRHRTKLADNLGLVTVGDLLRHFPRRYVRTTELTDLDDLAEGQLLTVVGEIAHSKLHSFTNRRTNRPGYRLQVVLRTGGPSLGMTFFASNKGMAGFFERRYRVGRRGLFLGKASRFREEWQLTNPEPLLFGAEDDRVDGGAGSGGRGAGGNDVLVTVPDLFPVYPLTASVTSWELQRATAFALDVVTDYPDVVPPPVRATYDLVDPATAYREIHGPQSYAQVSRSQRAFRFEEALVTQVVLARRRRAQQAVGGRPCTGGDAALLTAFDAALPFELTAGQRAVGAEIDADLAREHPMNRLLQGEVGSGKTLVAVRAMLRALDSGGQAALLAPTEVLAQQHHRSITALLGDLAGGGMLGGTSVELLTGSLTKSQRTGPLSRLASGESGIVVGTHALLEQQVTFADLRLVVVDEQHRFGVEQRAALAEKAVTPPHVLVMTATPIPRTVAMTVFGDLETSTLAELPAGRAPIQTTVVDLGANPGWFARVWQRVREEVDKGHQVYVVCPRIAGDQGEATLPPGVEALGIDPATEDAGLRTLAAVDDVLPALVEGPLAGLRVAPLHGSLPAEEKERTMRAFGAGELDVLVATTVIEVGVDVPNATAMVILDADRFGVSQLHQLRGRVGRGGHPGLCLLVTSAEEGAPAHERLAAVERTSDGFELSRIDLEQRREGDVLGRSQSGWKSTLTTLRVLRDEKTILQAREAAEALLDADPGLGATPDLAAAVADLEARSAAEFIERS